MESVLELRDISKHYPTHHAVNGVTLNIARGEFFSLLGPSGCGKTTTLRMIAGFEDPTSGEIHLNGAAIQHLKPYQRNVSTVFQMLNRRAVQVDLSGRRIFETRDHSEGSGLAASRRTEQRKELPTGDVQGDAIHGVMCGIVLRNISKLKDALHCKLNVTSVDRRV